MGRGGLGIGGDKVVGGAEVAMLWNASQAPMARKWSSHLDKEEELEDYRATPSQCPAWAPTQNSNPNLKTYRIFIEMQPSASVWVPICIRIAMCLCASVRVICELPVHLLLLCLIYWLYFMAAWLDTKWVFKLPT